MKLPYMTITATLTVYIRAMAVLLLAAVIAGCGSGASSQPSSFAGAWSGQWQDTERQTVRTVTLNIDSNGHAAGWYGVAGGQNSVLLGSVSSSGKVDLQIDEINPVPPLARLTGSLNHPTVDRLFGALTATRYGGAIFAATVDMTRQ